MEAGELELEVSAALLSRFPTSSLQLVEYSSWDRLDLPLDLAAFHEAFQLQFVVSALVACPLA